MPQVILAIDQGTTGTTVFVVDARGRIRGRAYAEIRQFYPKPGWVEHDPEEIYRSVVTLSKKAIAAAKVSVSAIAGIGITNQRETFVVWERRSGRPVYRAIVWQCRRSAARRLQGEPDCTVPQKRSVPDRAHRRDRAQRRDRGQHMCERV